MMDKEINSISNKTIYKWVFGFTGLALVTVSLLLFVFIRQDSHIKERNLSEVTVGDISQVTYSIDSENVNEKGDYIIKGWAVQRGVTYDYYNYGIDDNNSGVYNYMNLCYIKDNKLYVLPTKLEARKDVSEVLNDGIDYRYSGFNARVCEDDMYLTKGYQKAFLFKSPDDEEIVYIID